MSIKEPRTTKRYVAHASPYRGTRVDTAQRRRTKQPESSHLERIRRRITIAARKAITAPTRRRGSMIDALAADAIRQRRAGQTQNLRAFAHERGIPLDAE